MQGGHDLGQLLLHLVDALEHLAQVLLLEQVLDLGYALLEHPYGLVAVYLEDAHMELEWDEGELLFVIPYLL